MAAAVANEAPPPQSAGDTPAPVPPPPPPAGDAPTGDGEAVRRACMCVLEEPLIIAYRLVMFSFFWLGARRFQPEGRRHFDPTDVEAFQKHPAGKWDFLLQNFHVRWSIDHFFDRKGRFGEIKGQFFCCSCCCWEKPVVQHQFKKREVDIVTKEVIETDDAVVVVEEENHVIIKDELPERLVHQHFPIFVVLQCFVCIFLWVLWMALGPTDEQKELYGEGAAELEMAGLDNFWPGQTQLLWSGPYCKDLRAEVWRWWTYQFTFWNGWHLFGNVLGLLFLGISLEGLLGTARVFLAFNAGIIGSAIMYFIFEAHRILVGMSGGVFALLGMHFQQLLMNWKETRHHWPVLIVLIALACVEIIASKTDQLFSNLDMAMSCNLGGLVAGFLVSADLIMDFKVAKFERWSMILLSILFGATLVFCIVWLIINEDKPLSVFEAGELDEGYCWYRQSITYFSNYTMQECVRCSTRSCIDLWMHLETEGRRFIHLDDCRSQGWFYAGR